MEQVLRPYDGQSQSRSCHDQIVFKNTNGIILFLALRHSFFNQNGADDLLREITSRFVSVVNLYGGLKVEIGRAHV